MPTGPSVHRVMTHGWRVGLLLAAVLLAWKDFPGRAAT